MIEINSLDQLWQHVHELNKQNFPNNKLMPIVGNGKTLKPKVMFVFINPTKRNISSDKNWKGLRFPFIGTKQIWRIFHRSGLFDDELMHEINNSSIWSVEFTNKVLNFLQKQEFYITNIVKWTGEDATLPDSEKINLFLPTLEKEIEIVQPEYIVTFGLIPFERLTKQKIKLKDYYSEVINSKKLKFYLFKSSKIIPCYFPVGRGDPKKAVEILKLVNEL